MTAPTSHQADSVTHTIPTLQLLFKHRLHPGQIPIWRAAVCESAGWEADLFHNHEVKQNEEGEEVLGFQHRYPLIQYRSQRGQAAIWAAAEGVQSVRQWLDNTDLRHFKMGNTKITLKTEQHIERPHTLAMLEQPQLYRLMDYLPLNEESYKKWRSAKNFHQRLDILENVLVAHTLSMCKGLEWQLPQRLEISIFSIREVRAITFHGSKQLGVNLLFHANVEVPAGVAVGRKVAFGYGVVQPTATQANVL